MTNTGILKGFILISSGFILFVITFTSLCTVIDDTDGRTKDLNKSWQVLLANLLHTISV